MFYAQSIRGAAQISLSLPYASIPYSKLWNTRHSASNHFRKLCKWANFEVASRLINSVEPVAHDLFPSHNEKWRGYKTRRRGDDKIGYVLPATWYNCRNTKYSAVTVSRGKGLLLLFRFSSEVRLIRTPKPQSIINIPGSFYSTRRSVASNV